MEVNEENLFGDHRVGTAQPALATRSRFCFGMICDNIGFYGAYIVEWPASCYIHSQCTLMKIFKSHAQFETNGTKIYTDLSRNRD